MTEKKNPKAQKSRKSKEPEDGVIIIKKYANRRLYNTATSSYVTLDYLSELVKEGQDFVVYDAKSGDDITRSVLAQIIFEQESKGQNLLPVQFLRQLISFYGDSMQGYVPSYLEMSMDAFSKNQDKFKEQLNETFGAAPGFQMFEENVRKNMALYEQTMKMFTNNVRNMPGMPNVPGMSGADVAGADVSDKKNAASAPKGKAASKSNDDTDLDDIKSQLAALHEKLAKIEKE